MNTQINNKIEEISFEGAYTTSSKCFGFARRKLSISKGDDSIDNNCVGSNSIGAANSITIRVVDGE